MEPKLNRVTSGAIDAPLKRSGAEIKTLMFSAAAHNKAGSTEMITENNVNRAIVKEIRFFLDNNANQTWDANIDFETFRFKIYVFVSKDATYLNKAFEITQPLDNELCVYLEDNEDDILSEATASIKIGSALTADAERLKKIAISDTLAEMHQSLPGDNFSISEDDLSTLIQYGELRNTLRNTAFSLLQAINVVNIALGAVAEFLGNGLLSITKGLREYIQFKSHHWDPLSNKPTNDSPNANTDSFEPVLFPKSNDLINLFTESPEAGIETITNSIIQKLDEYKAEANNYFAQHNTLTVNAVDYDLESLGINPDLFNNLLSSSYEKIDSLFRFLLGGATQVIPSFKYLGTKVLNVVNAFYCGLWNSITEIVLGVVDFIGFIFKFLGAMGEFWTDLAGKLSRLLEMFDEFVQAFYEIDFTRIFQQVIDYVTNINLFALANEITLERMAYYLGAFVGMVVEIIISFLFSSGTLSIAKFGNAGTRLLSKVEAAAGSIFVKGISKNLPKQTIALIFHYLNQALSVMKSGTEEIIRMIQLFFEELVDLIKLGDKVLQKIIRKFNITPEASRLMDDLNMSFVDFEGGIATACKIDLK